MACERCGRELPSEAARKELDGGCPACVAKMIGEALDEADEARPLHPGETFLDYEILSVVGQGGMGIVYKARQASLDRVVALKVLAPALAHSPRFSRRFEHEARVLASLNHPNIVQIYAFGREGDRSYIAMEFVEGASLEERLEGRPRPALPALLAILKDVATGLDRIHAAGLVHRDIKPANVLIDRAGTAKISDFGLAIDPDDAARFTHAGAFIGTPHYVSPEQIQAGKLDGRSDLYAVGVMLFEAVTGRVPFEGTSAGTVLSKHLNDPPPLNRMAGIAPGRIVKLTGRLLAKEPEGRVASARELKTILEESMAEAELFKPGGVWSTSRAKAAANLRILLTTGRGRILASSVLAVFVVMALALVLLIQDRTTTVRVRDTLARAARSYETGDYPQAEASLREVLALRPGHAGAPFLLTLVEVRRYMDDRGIPPLLVNEWGTELLPLPGEPPESRARREMLERKLLASGRRPLAEGILAMWRGELDTALDLFGRVSTSLFEEGDARLYSVHVLYLREEFEAARGRLTPWGRSDHGLALELEVGLNVGLAVHHTNFRRFLKAADSYRRAFAACARASSLESDYLHARIAISQALAGHEPLGEVVLKEIAGRLENNTSPQAGFIRAQARLLGLFRGSGAPGEEELKTIAESFGRADPQSPEDAVTAFYRGFTWEWLARRYGDRDATRLQCLKEAVGAYEAAFRLNPGFVEAAVRAELGLDRIGGPHGITDSQARLRSLETLAGRLPAQARVHYALGVVRHSLARHRAAAGEKPEANLLTAVRDLEEAVRLGPKRVEPHDLLGRIHLELAVIAAARPSEASAHLERSIDHCSRRFDLAPRFTVALRTRAEARMRRAERPETTPEEHRKGYVLALEDLDLVLKAEPGDASIWRLREECLAQLDR